MKYTATAVTSEQEKRGDAIIRNKAGRKIKYKNQPPSIPSEKAEQKRPVCRKESRTRKVLCPRKSRARIRCRQETAAFRKHDTEDSKQQRAKFNIMFALANLIPWLTGPAWQLESVRSFGESKSTATLMDLTKMAAR